MFNRQFLARLIVSPMKVRRCNHHEQTTSKRPTTSDRIPTFAAISRQYLRPTRDWEHQQATKSLFVRAGRNGPGEPRALLIDGPRDFYLAHCSGQKPAERTFSRIFFAFIFFFLVYAFLTPPPPPGPFASAFASASASPSSSSSSSFSSSPSPPPLACAPSAKERSFEGRARRM